jgi:hypothetical protein
MSLRLLLVLVLSLALPAAAAPPPDEAAIRARVAAVVAALGREKASRSPAERKIGSRLLYGCRQRRGEAVAPGITTLRKQVDWDARGRTLVDLRAEVTDALLAAVEAAGGEIVNAYPRYDAVRAWLPEPAVGRLAGRPDVRGLRSAERFEVRKDDTSEGDVAHRADDLRVLESVDGSGVSVGVISNGVDTLADRQASGDLPAVTVLPGQAGSGDEGTAMLEVVYDLAPGASLLFATADGGRAAFASNILALEAAGADVIVDDIGYFAEGVFQDGIIAEAVDTVTAAGVLYVSAAGNDGNQSHGSSGVWEGDWVDSGTYYDDPLTSYTEGDLHAWDGATIWDNTIQSDGPAFALKWSDPLGASANDYDLVLLDPVGDLVDVSNTSQLGSEDPYEIIGSDPHDDTGNRLLVVNFLGSAAPRMLQLHSFGGELEFSTPGAIYGHPGARGAIATAAVDWWSAAGGAGPPAREFDGSESVEDFSSDGPRRVHYEADGTPITSGDFSSTGGELRAKPDLAGADGVSVSAPGFSPFFGTSAAAPHVAALGALLIQHGSATAADVRLAMEDSALDIEAAGDDRDSGHGIVEAVAAAALLPEPSSAVMLCCGALLLGRLARRRARG